MTGVTCCCGGVEARALAKLGKICLFVVKNICFFLCVVVVVFFFFFIFFFLSSCCYSCRLLVVLVLQFMN